MTLICSGCTHKSLNTAFTRPLRKSQINSRKSRQCFSNWFIYSTCSDCFEYFASKCHCCSDSKNPVCSKVKTHTICINNLRNSTLFASGIPSYWMYWWSTKMPTVQIGTICLQFEIILNYKSQTHRVNSINIFRLYIYMKRVPIYFRHRQQCYKTTSILIQHTTQGLSLNVKINATKSLNITQAKQEYTAKIKFTQTKQKNCNAKRKKELS